MGRIHLGTILGTTISLDFSFLIVVALFIVSDIQRWGMPHALLWAPVIFVSILFHEFAHAAAIGAFGYGSSQIVLEGMGGVTINERAAKPWQNMLISAAGPVSSFLLAWIIGQVVMNVPVAQRDPFLVAFLPFLFQMNVLWGKFNLLPVFPLDGSGVLRNFLLLFLSDRTSFAIAVWVSMITGVAVAIWGLMIKSLLLTILMAWYVRNSYIQWTFYRSYRRPED
jgi:Zn-dependent protease